jgi:hypothetical protein
MAYTYEVIVSDYGTESLMRTSDDGEIAFIPIDPANSDYAVYLADEAKTK